MLRPVKYLGQHFLSDKNIARKIAEAVNPQPDDVIVEIGAGEGFLTEQFVGRVKKVFAVEVDKRAVDFLKVRFGAEELVREDRIEIIHQDFLKLDLKMFEGFGKVRLIGNIPYSITSSIIFKAIENRNLIKDLTIMVQLEVAMRIVSNPGVKDYSILSVLCQAYSKPEILFRVSNVLKIKKTNDELKKLRSEFTYLLIQDLKNTISVIKGSFELALKNKLNELSGDQKLILEIAETAINKHIKLLNEYLELSRLEFNIDKISREQTELDKIITDVLEKFKSNLNLTFQAFADEPSFQIYADKKKITRVIELILDAISNAGGKDVEILLTQDSSNCLIKIVDKTQTIDIEFIYLTGINKQCFKSCHATTTLGLR